MKDSYGRVIDYLRISVTDRCNFRCQYCMAESGVEFKKHEEILNFEEIIRIVRIAASEGIKKIKITGGEPLVRKDIIDLIRNIRNVEGIEDVTITTNGLLLKEYAKDLSELVSCVNVSIDTLDAEKFRRITRLGDLNKVLDGVEEMLKYDKVMVKVNAVALKENLEDFPRLAFLAKSKRIHVRFIEEMPIGLGNSKESLHEDELVSKLEESLGKLKPINVHVGNGPAHYYEVEGFAGYIGFISAISHKYCHECNRVRLTSEGFLKTCLQYNVGEDLKTPMRNGASDEEIRALFRKAIARKPMEHSFDKNIIEEREYRSMSQIGG